MTLEEMSGKELMYLDVCSLMGVGTFKVADLNSGVRVEVRGEGRQITVLGHERVDPELIRK